MKTVLEYIRHAEECEEMAAKATGEKREMITKMAETWRMLAEQRKQKLAKQKTSGAA
jgi:hypothetical protein